MSTNKEQNWTEELLSNNVTTGRRDFFTQASTWWSDVGLPHSVSHSSSVPCMSTRNLPGGGGGGGKWRPARKADNLTPNCEPTV
jgi:hypothetical protein